MKAINRHEGINHFRWNGVAMQARKTKPVLMRELLATVDPVSGKRPFNYRAALMVANHRVSRRMPVLR